MEPTAWILAPEAQNLIWILCLAASLSFWVIPGESRHEGGRT